jgi:hypothetical protein
MPWFLPSAFPLQAAEFACGLFDDVARAISLSPDTPLPAYNAEIDWAPTWQIVGTEQPPGCNLTASGLQLPGEGRYMNCLMHDASCTVTEWLLVKTVQVTSSTSSMTRR